MEYTTTKSQKFSTYNLPLQQITTQLLKTSKTLNIILKCLRMNKYFKCVAKLNLIKLIQWT